MAQTNPTETSPSPHSDNPARVGDKLDIPAVDINTSAKVTAVDHDGPVVSSVAHRNAESVAERLILNTCTGHPKRAMELLSLCED